MTFRKTTFTVGAMLALGFSVGTAEQTAAGSGSAAPQPIEQRHRVSQATSDVIPWD